MAIGNNKKLKILALSIPSQMTRKHEKYLDWIPAYAGMTVKSCTCPRLSQNSTIEFLN